MQPFYKPTGNLFSSIICTNCSTSGHTSKHCSKPITSYGVILFRCKDSWNQAAILQSERTTLTGLEPVAGSIEYLLIQRKDSIGFIELIRGKYKVTDMEYIAKNIAGMTATEREKIRTQSFDDFWGGQRTAFTPTSTKRSRGDRNWMLFAREHRHSRHFLMRRPPPLTLQSGAFQRGGRI